jgi:hypothetical protein
VRGTGTGKPRRGSGVVCGGVAEAEVGVFGALLAVFVSLTSKIGRLEPLYLRPNLIHASRSSPGLYATRLTYLLVLVTATVYIHTA